MASALSPMEAVAACGKSACSETCSLAPADRSICPGGGLRGGRRPGLKLRRRRCGPTRRGAAELAEGFAPDCSSEVIYAFNMPVPTSNAMANWPGLDTVSYRDDGSPADC